MVFIPKKKPQALAATRVAVGNLVTVPYCTGGWNTKDPLPSMAPQDAVILDNYIVENERIVSRAGYDESADELDGDVESIFEFANDDEIKIISSAGDKIYEGLSPSVNEIGSGYMNARWQGFMMNQNLLLFNGEDIPQKYDGTTLSANTFTGSGLVVTNLVGGTSFKNRIIIWENNKCGFWFGDSDAISGALDFFDLSFVTRRGGYVIACASWSYNSPGGTGLQARLAIFMSTGEALVYEGTDPGTAESWAIVGRYKVAPPISQRAIIELAGDILIVNKFDLISFSAVIQTGENPDTQSKLVGAIRAAVAAYGLNFGWQLLNFPLSALIIVNVPTSTNSTYQQFVINTRSGGCSRFTGYNARCFAVYNNLLYFGGLGTINQALVGDDDNGEFINVDSQSAFNTLGTNKEKTLNYVKPYMAIDNDISFGAALNYDFQSKTLATQQLISNSGNLWDTFFWDTVFWSAEDEIKSVQYGASGQGVFVSYRIKAQIKQRVAFYSILYSVEIDNL